MTTSTTTETDPSDDLDAAIHAATRELVARRNGTSTPAGRYTERGHWKQDDSERRECCRRHAPGQTYPQALRKHCLGAEHVARLFDVPVDAVRAAATRLSR